MSQKIDASSDILPSGQITFYQASLAPLVAGDYQLVATQQPNLPNADEQPPAYTVTQPLTIDGPRYRLQPTDVQMVYPPARQQGAFAGMLPHAVLRQRDLPWARSIGAQGTRTTPWVALLTVYQGSESSLVTSPSRMTVANVVQPGQGVLGPALGTLSADELAQACLAFDVDAAFFQAIAPTLDELPFLAHARSVDTQAKETTGGVQAGFFSVVVGNRLPDASTTGARDSAVFLVSLEGHAQHLPGGPALPSGTNQIRLIVLASWTFTTSASPGDFIGLMQALPARGGVGLLEMPHALADTSSPAQRYAQEGLDIGYVPLQDLTRSGEQTTSWYRGPFAPYATTRETGGPYTTSDSAMQYDPDYGLFALSYATAWQIGRLLALADRSFAQTMIQWRRAQYQASAADQAVVDFAARLGAPAGLATSPETRRARQADVLQHFLVGSLGALGRREKVAPRLLPRSLRLDPERLPGLVRTERLESARLRQEEPLHAIAAHLFDETP